MTVCWVLCIQVVIVSTWKLLTLVKSDRIFTDASFMWVNAIVWAIAAAWVVLVGVLFYVGFNADDPGLPLLLFLMSVGVTVLGPLMVVMRALLQQATTLRATWKQLSDAHRGAHRRRAGQTQDERRRILRACRAHAGERRSSEERSCQGCSFQHPGCHVPGARLPAR